MSYQGLEWKAKQGSATLLHLAILLGRLTCYQFTNLPIYQFTYQLTNDIGNMFNRIIYVMAVAFCFGATIGIIKIILLG